MMRTHLKGAGADVIFNPNYSLREKSSGLVELNYLNDFFLKLKVKNIS